ncbi:MAG: HEAT repeat domain-containing protein [Pirellulales bacterium]|nr:HEAT repeat domain-containing protein [Pirellulales bacterium]
MSRASFAFAVLFLSAATAVGGADLAELLQDLKSGDEQVCLKAIDSLGEQGVASLEVLQALSEQLRGDSALVRAHAAAALGRFGPAARPVVKALAPLIADPDARVRRMAVRAWTRIRPGPEVSIPAFVKALDDADPAVRGHVLTLLVEVGKPAVPALVKALESEKTAYWSCLALSEIGSDAASAVPALTELLQSAARPEVRREAVLALGEIGPAAAAAVEALAKALDDKNIVVRCGAAYALGRIGPAAESAEPALTEMAENADPMLKTSAAWALAKIHPRDETRREKALAALSAALGDKDRHVRLMAMRGLVDLQPTPEAMLAAIKNANISAKDEIVGELLVVSAGLGKPAVPLLIESLQIDRVSPLAASLLGRMGPTASEALPALADAAANSTNLAARCEALLAIGAIGSDAPQAARTAAAALNDEEEDVRYAACFALGKIGKPAAAVAPELEKLLADKDEHLALAAAWALAHVEPTSAEIAARSVPLLIAALKNSEPRVRCEAAVALGCLGSLAKDAAPALKEATRDKNDFVRDAADEALDSIGR